MENERKDKVKRVLKKAKKEAKKRGLLTEDGGITANLLEEDLLGHQHNNVGKKHPPIPHNKNARSSNPLASVGNLNNTQSSFSQNNFSANLSATELK